MNLIEKLNASRKELLDMSLRNPLLNFRPLKSKGLEITDEKPEELYRLLVNNNKSMTFLSAKVPIPESRTSDVSDSEHLELLNKTYSDLKLQTNYSEKELQARLLSTYLTAKTYIEERGVNTLFLALGMLNWKESDDSDKYYKAPLVLVPVELTRSNARERFVLTYTQEEIQLNISLSAKFLSEYSIKIATEKDELDLPEYFNEIEQAIVSQKKWYIDKEASALGFFSFGKYLMFMDLDTEKWPEHAKLTEHPILNALLGDGFREAESEIQDDEHIDKHIKPDELYHIVEADSSQVLSILDVKSGRNTVIQGPPGTGKSQTITNIIADAVGRGKKVLFVSEKLAALEVVKRRLDNVGIGDACLEIHSQKSNKKLILNELQKTLELGAPKWEESTEIFNLLRDLRDELNEYCEAVNMPIENSRITPFMAYGETTRVKNIFNRAGVKIPRVELNGIESWSEEEAAKKLSKLRELASHISNMGIPSKHVFWGSKIKTFLPQDKDKFEELLHDFKSGINKLCDYIKEVCGYINYEIPSNYKQAEKISYSLQQFADSPDLLDFNIRNDKWLKDETEIFSLIDSGIKCKEIYEKNEQLLIEEAWEQDVLSIRQNLVTFIGKWWKVLSPAYRNSCNLFAGLLKRPQKLTLEQKVAILDEILTFKRLSKLINENELTAKSLFADSYKGHLKTEWSKIKSLSEWLVNLYKEINNGKTAEEVIGWLDVSLDKTKITAYLPVLSNFMTKYKDAYNAIAKFLLLDNQMRFNDIEWQYNADFGEILKLVDEWEKNAGEIQLMAIYNRFSDELSSLGLLNIVNIAESWEHSDKYLDKVFIYERNNALLVKAFKDRKILASFEGMKHEQKIDQFKVLDVNIMDINRSRLLYEHWKHMPKNSSQEGQLGVLLWEFQKKTRHMPIRKLMIKAGNIIQTIKPIMMMSPLSIANFIEPGCLNFDLVIFDEASQVRPVEAFGALLRAKQAVVVGDSCQMPPTSFFDNAMDFSEEEDEDYIGDMESILGLFVAKNAPQRMLRWHYRSKHESLITVSNHEFYNDKLVIFPSADYKKDNIGLVYRYLPNSFYDRGRTRTNPIEAKEVALQVMKHAKETPHLTLGVAAFSMAQMQAIFDQLEIIRRQDNSAEDFFQGHKEEPFFVKNLENVQGDERDVIFISIGYGKTAEGNLAMEFGPLNREGGERRLNVLITRARQRCEVFTNLTADDIDINRSNSKGVKALKTFLNYAKDGRMDIPAVADKKEESELERAVYQHLVDKGLSVRKQVGCAGFYIDLAVVDPEKSGSYLLGIECDGAAYHSARSARDRDRLRQAVLENKGWKIHRVWSTDWFRNPDKELEKINEAIKKAKEQNQVNAENNERTTIKPAAAFKAVERNDAISPQTSENVQPYIIATDIYQNDQTLYSPALLSKMVTDIVYMESPVHIDEVLRRVTNASGVKRAGRVIQESFMEAISLAVNNGKIKQKGSFLWSADMNIPVLRTREGLTPADKKLEYIAPEELCLAIKVVVKNSCGMLKDEIPLSACRLLGFSRTTEDVNSIMFEQIEKMLRDEELSLQGEHLVYQ